MEAAIVAGIVALTVCLITGLVTWRVKKLDLLGQSQQRKAENLKKGYDQMLAAMDIAWHYHCHAELANVGWDPPFDWESKWPAVRDKVNHTAGDAIDLLKANSLNYGSVSTAILWATRVIWDGITLKMQKSTPDDYAEVRDMVVYCSRADDRLERPLKKRFWKRVKKQNRQRPPESGMEKLSHMQAVLQRAFLEGHDDVVMVSQDQDAMFAYLNSFGTIPPIYVPSLEHSWRRMKSWTAQQVITSDDIPCLSLEPPCHVQANEKLKERKPNRE